MTKLPLIMASRVYSFLSLRYGKVAPITTSYLKWQTSMSRYSNRYYGSKDDPEAYIHNGDTLQVLISLNPILWIVHSNIIIPSYPYQWGLLTELLESYRCSGDSVIRRQWCGTLLGDINSAREFDEAYSRYKGVGNPTKKAYRHKFDKPNRLIALEDILKKMSSLSDKKD